MRALRSWTSEIILSIIVGLYALAGWMACVYAGQTDRFHVFAYLGTGWLFTRALFYLFIMVYAVYLFWLLFRRRPSRPLAFLKERVMSGPLNPERLKRAAPIFVIMVVLFSVFTSMKFMIAAFQPFSWDLTFVRLDRWLHFGVDPWRLTMPFFGYPFVTWIVNLIYNIWLPILFIMVYWQMFSMKNPAARMQFFIATALVWSVEGSLLAILFSSAGPCYLERLINDTHYAPLMAYLSQANGQYNIMALPTQDKLWDAYKSGGFMLGGGISAMPSIHVATSLLYLLLALKMKLRIWPLFAVFFAFILFGSVHLGWHYAVDGYLAILATVPIWLASGWLIGSYDRIRGVQT